MREVQRAQKSGNSYRLVIMDYRMGGSLDGGVETIRSIQKIFGETSPPFIVLSSADEMEAGTWCRESKGCTFLMKPMKKDELKDTIKKYFSVSRMIKRSKESKLLCIKQTLMCLWWKITGLIYSLSRLC